MNRAHEWLTVTVPGYFSSWLLKAYRRPLRSLLALVVLPVVAVFVGTQTVSVSLWRQQALRHLAVTARLAAEIVDETIEETLRFEGQLAAQPEFEDAVSRRDRPAMTRHLQAALAFIPRVDLALVISPQGEVLAAFPADLNLVGRTVNEEEPFRGAREGGWHPYVSAVYLREGPEIEKVVGVVLPVEHDGAVVGLLQFQHRVEEVKSWLQKIRVDPEGFLYVVDHHDQLVVYPFQVLPGKPTVVSDWPPVAYPLPPEGGTLIFHDPRSGQRRLAGMHPIETSGWRVVAVQPERAALGVLRRVLWPMGLLVGLLGLLLVAVSLRWAQLQAFSLRLLHQNTKLLKQQQQRRFFESGPNAP